MVFPRLRKHGVLLAATFLFLTTHVGATAAAGAAMLDQSGGSTQVGLLNQWLADAGVQPKAAAAIKREGVEDVCDLALLTDSDLRRLGVRLVPLRKLRARVGRACPASAPAPPG